MRLVGAFLICALLSVSAAARNPRGGAIPVTVTVNSVVNFTFVPPTLNVDSSPITAGEITGYEMGIRLTSVGSAGTYSILIEIPLSTVGSLLSSAIQAQLASGAYSAAVRTVGSTNSAWSSEVAFTQ